MLDKNNYKRESVVTGDADGVYWRDEYIEITVHGGKTYGGRIDNITREGIQLDNSTRFYADSRFFSFDEIAHIRGSMLEHEVKPNN